VLKISLYSQPYAVNREVENMRIPEFLKSTYIMLIEAFPNGICEEYYWVILYLLYDYISDRNLALVMSYLINKPSEIIMNDIYRVCQMEFNFKLIEEINGKLDKYGFEEWKKED